MNYTTLSLADVRAGLGAIAGDAQSTFGRLNVAQLNWSASPGQWSVGQCFDHLLSANRQMFAAADAALAGTAPRSVWQRLPVLPGLFGRALIRSQSPTSTKKYKAPAVAQPAASDVAADVIQRFVQQADIARTRLEGLDDAAAARTVMTSPFIRLITYSVLDGWRLIVAHEHRHCEQARRVTQSPGFPRS
jgi:hypothetical protein